MNEYTDLVAKMVACILFEAYDNYRMWILSRRRTAFMRKLLLKPVLVSDENVEILNHILILTSETDFKPIPQHWDSCSKRRDQSGVSGRRVGTYWFYYNSYMCMRILER